MTARLPETAAEVSKAFHKAAEKGFFAKKRQTF